MTANVADRSVAVGQEGSQPSIQLRLWTVASTTRLDPPSTALCSAMCCSQSSRTEVLFQCNVIRTYSATSSSRKCAKGACQLSMEMKQNRTRVSISFRKVYKIFE
mmetsp:Transcript_24505/g.53435  ORF Transcript_24505/g.53435 Transcript_24505/m.53435 type:complete len:105 (+) Transcript_24505:469-783(+)